MALIGYAEADFHSLITRGHYYVDRTSFIAEQERLGNRNLLFARPRRIGKSLWISTLHHYYDIRFKDEFETLFGNLYIGKNPTPNRNNYIVLRFQFSGIDVSSDERAYEGFRKNIQMGIRQCMLAYPNYFLSQDISDIEHLSSPEGILQEFLFLYRRRGVPYKIYILIDEYDHFANELFSLDIERFQNIVSRTGFVRKFYELIKNAMGEGVVERNFMTGVAPLTVGFDTVSHITRQVDFHKLMGFTEQEVTAIMQAVGVSESNIPKIMSDLTEWYNGYLFHHKATERLYNSDMVMYFAEQYERYQFYSDKMLNINIVRDYPKVQEVFVVNSEDTIYVPLLKKIVSEGRTSAILTEIFNFEKPFDEYDIVSLLFYMGWLTIKQAEEGECNYTFNIPNRVIQELYYDYFVAISEQETNLNRTLVDIL
jgi:Predicted AAA-ATPase